MRDVLWHIRLIWPIWLMRPMSLIWPMRLMSPIWLIGSICLLLACSSSDGDEGWTAPTEVQPTEPEMAKTPITFGGSEDQGQNVNMVKAQRTDYGTRAVRPLSDLVSQFNVWGYKNMSYDSGTESFGDLQTVFPKYYVEWRENSAATSATNTSNWDYIVSSHPNQSIKFWDWSARAYRFFAVTGWDAATPAPATAAEYDPTKSYTASETSTAYAVSMTADAAVFTGSPAAYDADATATRMEATPYFSRLWFSTGQPATYPDMLFGHPVTLEFLKPYARVRFMYKYVNPRVALILRNQEFKPSDGSKIIRKGIVTVNYPLVGTEKLESYSVVGNADPDPAVSGALDAFTVDYDPEDDSKVYPAEAPEGWYTVLPNMAQGTYTLSLTINDVPRTAVVPVNLMQWKAGYSYTYVFKILDEGGVVIDLVESAVTPWTDVNAYHEVYNW